jgi:hypothetical protein
VTRREKRERAALLDEAREVLTAAAVRRKGRLERRKARINAMHNGVTLQHEALERGRTLMLEGLQRLGVL